MNCSQTDNKTSVLKDVSRPPVFQPFINDCHKNPPKLVLGNWDTIQVLKRCMVPRHIHTHPNRGSQEISRGQGGSKTKDFKLIKWNFLRENAKKSFDIYWDGEVHVWLLSRKTQLLSVAAIPYQHVACDLFACLLFFQGPIITDLGGLPGSYNEMTSDEFEQLLEKMCHLKIMTISPHAEASNDYERIKSLLKRCRYIYSSND